MLPLVTSLHLGDVTFRQAVHYRRYPSAVEDGLVGPIRTPQQALEASWIPFLCQATCFRDRWSGRRRGCTAAICSSYRARSASARWDRRSVPGCTSSTTRSPSQVEAALSGRGASSKRAKLYVAYCTQC